MEKKITMQKDNVMKLISINLVSEYMQLGWTKVSDNGSKKKMDKNKYNNETIL